MENETKNSFAVPVAIIIAGLIIGGAVYLKGGVPTGQGGNAGDAFSPDPLKKLSAVTNEDWVRGNPKAPITIIEFSDLECPFCKRFHETMLDIAAAYPNDVAWVYRHFPLDQLHKKARPEAEAAECAGKLGGNDAFWKFTDKIFETTPSNDGLDLSLLPQFATELGLNKADFEKCLTNGETKELVNKDYEEAVAVGGRGTPYPIIITKNGEKVALQGAVPFENMKEGIDKILSETK